MGSIKNQVSETSELTPEILIEAIMIRDQHGKDAIKTLLMGLKEFDRKNSKTSHPTKYAEAGKNLFNRAIENMAQKTEDRKMKKGILIHKLNNKFSTTMYAQVDENELRKILKKNNLELIQVIKSVKIGWYGHYSNIYIFKDGDEINYFTRENRWGNDYKCTIFIETNEHIELTDKLIVSEALSSQLGCERQKITYNL